MTTGRRIERNAGVTFRRTGGIPTMPSAMLEELAAAAHARLG